MNKNYKPSLSEMLNKEIEENRIRNTYFECQSCGNKKHFHIEESDGWEYRPDYILLCNMCPSWEEPNQISYSRFSGNYLKTRFRK